MIWKQVVENTMLVKYAVLFLALMILAGSYGCASRYFPQPSQMVRVVDNYAVFEDEGISLAISTRMWVREPQRVNDYFTTFHLVVINRSAQAITISPEDFILLDEERNQYDVLHYEEVASVLIRDDFFIDRFPPVQDRQQQVTDERILGRAYLMQDSFHYGDILPNARKNGYIFFNRISPNNRLKTILFRGQEIRFIRQ